jgi:hypothetical protein
MAGKKNWYIVDGYKPPQHESGDKNYEGHECIMILNCENSDANVNIDVYFMDREPVTGLKFIAPAKRISAFRSDDKNVFGELDLVERLQYSIHITSDVEVIVQYGRMDINQSNLAYLATLGYAE